MRGCHGWSTVVWQHHNIEKRRPAKAAGDGKNSVLRTRKVPLAPSRGMLAMAAWNAEACPTWSFGIASCK